MSRACLYNLPISARRLKLLKVEGWTWQSYGKRRWYYPIDTPAFRYLDSIGICTARRGYYVGPPRAPSIELKPAKLENMLAGPFRNIDDAIVCYRIIAGVK